MKKQFSTPAILIVAAAISMASCKKNNDAQAPQNNNADGQLLASFLQKNAPSFQSFTVDAAAGGTVTTTKGTKFIIPANIFVTASGAPVTGSVSFSVKEIKDVSDMILGDKPTLTSDGRMLVSYGEFFTKASQNNQDLQIKKDSAIKVQVQAKPNGAGGQDIPIWSGDSTITTTLSGYDYQNNATSVTVQTAVNKGVVWNQKAASYSFFNSGNGSLDFKLDSLMKWVNCDGLYNLPGTKTTVMGYFASNFNPLTTANYGGEQPTMLFFKPTGQKTLAKFYNVILNAPAGYEGLHSYQTSIVIGQQGTFLAMSVKDGKFYAEMKDVTIGTPAGSNNYTSVTFNPQEVTESAMLALVIQMNAK